MTDKPNKPAGEADQDLLKLLYDSGFRNAQGLSKAYAVAKAESNGRPMAYNGNASTGDKSYGVFQINMLGGLGPARINKFKEPYGITKNEDLFDPRKNARVAAHMSKRGDNWSSWSTYNTKRYNSNLPDVGAVAKQIDTWRFSPNNLAETRRNTRNSDSHSVSMLGGPITPIVKPTPIKLNSGSPKSDLNKFNTNAGTGVGNNLTPDGTDYMSSGKLPNSSAMAGPQFSATTVKTPVA